MRVGLPLEKLVCLATSHEHLYRDVEGKYLSPSPSPLMATYMCSWTAISVHSLLIIAFSGVWLWHLTPKANEQDVAQKYGWFWQVRPIS